jgi:hypothetical protein
MQLGFRCKRANTSFELLDRDPIIERRVRCHGVIYKFPQGSDERFMRQIVIYDLIPIQKLHLSHDCILVITCCLTKI